MSITVNSPPVVTFTVNDANGQPVTGLKLFDPAGTAGDPACGGSNVTLAIAKYDGNNWQNLISRQRYAVDDLSDPAAPKHAVIEGTTDPKPTASITNPTTAVSDPSTRVVGILEEANGVYTYRFATDVTTSLLIANAVAGRNVAVGKVANNGNLAVKDGSTLHRVALQLCYVDPVTKQTMKLNPSMDFILGANGTGVPVQDSQGRLVPAIQVVDRAACNECHQNLGLHGGNRVDPLYCVMCHNPGSSDYATGNPIDLKLMVHKFHMGKRLTQDYAVQAAIARKNTAGVITGMLYPQDQRNCTKCHDGSSTAVHKTAQGDNWRTKPSKNACLACHDDYKVAGSKWQLAHKGAPGVNVANPDANPDSLCASCHGDAAPLILTAVKHAIPEFGLAANYQYNIWNITKNLDNTVTVEYSVSNPNTGIDYDILHSSYRYTVVNTAGTTTTRTFRFGALNMLFGWNTRDYGNDGAIGRPWNSSCTVTPTASPSCDATTGLPTAKTPGPITRGQPVAINVVFDSSVQRVGTSNHFKLTSTVLPAAANGTIAVAFQGRVSEQKDANTSWSVPVANVVRYFAMNGTVQPRRQVVSADKCNACHGRNIAFTNTTTFLPGLGGHGGSRTDPEVCVICHNGNNVLNGTTVAGGVVTVQPDSADFKRMIHMMHKSQGANYPVMPSTLIATGAMAGTYTGLMNCNVCHVNGSYKQSLSVLGSSTVLDVDLSVDSNNATITDTNPADNWVISPTASACSACHTDADPGNPVMLNHMVNVGGAKFGTARQGDIAAGQVFEACDGCHLTSGIAPVGSAHLGASQ